MRTENALELPLEETPKREDVLRSWRLWYAERGRRGLDDEPETTDDPTDDFLWGEVACEVGNKSMHLLTWP